MAPFATTALCARAHTHTHALGGWWFGLVWVDPGIQRTWPGMGNSINADKLSALAARVASNEVLPNERKKKESPPQ
jgi:hypothetical protein